MSVLRKSVSKDDIAVYWDMLSILTLDTNIDIPPNFRAQCPANSFRLTGSRCLRSFLKRSATSGRNNSFSLCCMHNKE